MTEAVWRGALKVIQAAYGPEKDPTAWLTSITNAAGSIGARPYGYAVDLTPAAPQLTAIAGDPELALNIGQAAMHALATLPIELIRAFHSINPPVETSSIREARLAKRRALTPDWLTAACAGHFPIDSLGMVAADPDGPYALLLAFHEVGPRVPSHLQKPLELLSAHLSAAMRLRRALSEEVDAVIDANGRVLDAKGEATQPEARASLAEAALRMDKARLRETSPEEAVELWNAMTDGTWTVVENIESDGKRLMLARRNPPDVRSFSALSAREQRIASYAANGHPYKLIAYELGLPVSTVATTLEAALVKLGFPSRTAFIAAHGGDEG